MGDICLILPFKQDLTFPLAVDQHVYIDNWVGGTFIIIYVIYIADQQPVDISCKLSQLKTRFLGNIRKILQNVVC